MNTGIQDAFNLGWKLAAVLRGAPSLLLDSYEEERLPVAASVLALSNDLLRKTIEGRGIVFDRSARTQQLGITYRGTSLSNDGLSGDAPIRAGDRAPDAPGLTSGGDTVRLFDLMRGTHVTVIVFEPKAVDKAKSAFARFGDQIRLVVITAAGQLSPHEQLDHWEDTGGHARRTYAAQPGMIFVIRPDGYVGLSDVGERWVDVMAYLARVAPTIGDVAVAP